MTTSTEIETNPLPTAAAITSAKTVWVLVIQEKHKLCPRSMVTFVFDHDPDFYDIGRARRTLSMPGFWYVTEHEVAV